MDVEQAVKLGSVCLALACGDSNKLTVRQRRATVSRTSFARSRRRTTASSSTLTARWRLGEVPMGTGCCCKLQELRVTECISSRILGRALVPLAREMLQSRSSSGASPVQSLARLQQLRYRSTRC